MLAGLLMGDLRGKRLDAERLPPFEKLEKIFFLLEAMTGTTERAAAIAWINALYPTESF